jgi:hypothetical protein
MKQQELTKRCTGQAGERGVIWQVLRKLQQVKSSRPESNCI